MSNKEKTIRRIRWAVVRRMLLMAVIITWYGLALYGLPELIASGNRFEWFWQTVKAILLLVLAVQVATAIRQQLRELARLSYHG